MISSRCSRKSSQARLESNSSSRRLRLKARQIMVSLRTRSSLHLHHPTPNIHLSFHADVFKGLLPEPVLAKSLMTPCHGAVGRPRRKYAVHA